MKKNLLCSLLSLLLVLGLYSPAHATAPPTTGRPLGEALNPDGTLRPGLNGSFDARQFRMGTAPDGRPVFRPLGTTGAGDERWADGFGLNGADGVVIAVVRAGTDIYIGGQFTVVGGVEANRIAKWNGTAWSSLGTGNSNGVGDPLNSNLYGSSVNALAVASNGDVYVGGKFDQAGGAAANNVAKWNGSAWSSLGTGAGNGVDNLVNVLAVSSSGAVYVGGGFTQAGGLAANRVAKWNGTAWSSLGTGASNGVNSGVNALAVASNGDVYIGGYFSQAGGVTANSVAKWNGTVWSSLGTGNGVDGPVIALAMSSSGEVYIGGFFSQVDGVAAICVAKWNGTAWSSLGTGNGVGGPVNALAVSGSGEVYVGYTFIQAGGVNTNRVAKWNGTAWSTLGTTGNGVPGLVSALAVAGSGEVYVGGFFSQVDGVVASRVAKWSGTAWSSLGTGNGVDDFITALAVASNGEVYVGGNFMRVGGVAANHIAKWNGTAWSSLGTGTGNGVDGLVRALAVASSGEVYVGGDFMWAGGVAANYVAKWNGTAWSSLGTGAGNGVDSRVRALAVASNGEVYVGGDFVQAGGATASRIAKWNGTAWSSLGTGASNGVDDIVNALAVSGSGELYVGGNFMWAGGATASRIAKWNGTAWSSLGTGVGNGVNSRAYALAVASSGEVYVGGDFMRAGGVAANRVAKWNGTAWSSLGMGTDNGVSGPSSYVYALAVSSSGEVYVGGTFTQAGAIATSNVARWNGMEWNNLGTGLHSHSGSMALGFAGKLYAGGAFTGTGDGSKVMAYFGIYDPNAPLATTVAKAIPAAQLFPNPAHGTATLRLPAGAPRLALTLTDALGRTVRRYPAPAASADAELDLRGLPAGAYVVRCGEYAQRLVVE
ncbi:hypothetical protein [Hymenobacter negativus]|uniref:Rax2-like C-terminal domain-containing protein n=1 Tax=Hymenobacter negativus TaxID=2795026 RepID=A0ABS3QEC6_9BACT|nr:hypothetical protein [Hymenobacter negativus]MBO2009353.1 hypothetical protein [Hymenobacter negativus]